MRVIATTLLASCCAVAGASAQPQASDQSREAQLKRITKATGAPPAYSNGYWKRVIDAIRPNLTPPDAIEGNPATEVEIRTKTDGSIASIMLTTSSGNAVWDAAVLRAIERTGRIPRDTAGGLPPVLSVTLRPR